MNDLARIQRALTPLPQAGPNNIISTGFEAQTVVAPDQVVPQKKKDSPFSERSHSMQFRNSKDGEGTSPRGSSQTTTPHVNNASVITADEDVLHEAFVYNKTLESPLHLHEPALHNWKKETVNHEPELECQNWKKKAVNYGPYHEQEREYNKTFESPRDETALNNQKHEHEHTEVQLDRINEIKQSILEVLAEHNTQNKNELTGIKELLETVTKAQGNLAGRLEQVEPESAKIKEYDKKQGGGEIFPSTRQKILSP